MGYFENKVVWITGASGGIGEALAYAFAAAGAVLVLSARRVTELERVKANCGNAVVHVLPLDLAAGETLPAKYAWVLQTAGKIDILVNNGGISQRSFAKDTVMDVYRNIMEVNFFGSIQLSNLVLQHFLERNSGQFVVIGSIANLVGIASRSAYSASKNALEGFYGSLRAELWKTDVRILMVRPGAVKTDIGKHALAGDGSLNKNEADIVDKGIEPATLAASILTAIKKNKHSLLAGPFAQRMVVQLNRVLPGLVFHLVKKVNS